MDFVISYFIKEMKRKNKALYFILLKYYHEYKKIK